MNFLSEETLDCLWKQLFRLGNALNAFVDKDEFVECYFNQGVRVEPNVDFAVCRIDSSEPFGPDNIRFIVLESEYDKQRATSPVVRRWSYA